MDHFSGDINSPVKSNFEKHPGKSLSRTLPVLKILYYDVFLEFYCQNVYKEFIELNIKI